MITCQQKKMNTTALKKADDEENKTDESDIEKEEEGLWKPWLVSLSIDIISRITRRMQPMTNLEKDESRRRDYLFIYYLFRGPIYLKITR